MKINIKEATDLSTTFLTGLGLSAKEAGYVTQNIINAELAGRKTHGFVRLLGFKRSSDNKTFNTNPLKIEVINESPVSLYLNGHNKLGYAPIYESLEMAFEKIKASKLLAVGLKDLNVTGYIGDYARLATEKDLIFIGFNNSTGGLVPYGSIKEMWGTNPLTVGIPTNGIPVILDMASSQITWGDLLVAKNEGEQISEGAAIDSQGKPTTDPEKAMGGGVLPFFGHKGSGLAFIVELLGGALTGSRVGSQVPGGWGSFYILIDPTLFRPLADFKKDIETAINELKNAPKAKGFTNIYFAGEQSASLRQKQLAEGLVEISDVTLKQVKREVNKNA
ncbi:MAG: Ldh family oxidoreductase [Candidatus Pacebacteria bacterium]|nr:Ldh family oxidoreductase [Candidatus Paceibacterota bacterium]